MRIFLRASIFTTIITAFFISAAGQQFSQTELKKFLQKAGEQTADYSLKFKNLSAEESKFFETFDGGNLKRRKTILSDLIVYESPKLPDRLGEFRNVREVDGKFVEDGESRAVKLFAKLADADSFAEELKKLDRESSRYDEGLSFSGLTLFQAIPLGVGIIESFKFEEINREIIEGRESVAVKFQQTVVNPNIKNNLDTPEYLQVSNSFFRGIVWLDLKNYRILKLILELTLESPRLTEPLTVLKQEFYYHPGSFEIYLPQKIVSEQYVPKIGKSLRLLMKSRRVKVESEIRTRLKTEYKNFSQFEVTVKFNRQPSQKK